MNSPNDITSVLAENGNYDDAKAAEIKNQVLKTFTANLRKVERIYWGYMCLCSWLFVFALFHFLHSSSPKALLFYGILMVVFFQTTVLMKLWYWIANQKIMVLKAVKQLELASAPSPKDGSQSEGLRRPVEGLARRERIVWWIVLFTGCALIGALKTAEVGNAIDPWGFDKAETLSSAGCMILNSDGSGMNDTETSFVDSGALARRGMSFHAPKSEKVRFVDGTGQEMPFTMAPQNGHIRYDVTLPRPIMPGERFAYTRHSLTADAATQDDGLWTCSYDVSYGYNTNEISQTIVLPAGAEIVSTNPWPESTFMLQGKPTVRFTGVRASNEPLKMEVKYRLAEEAVE